MPVRAGREMRGNSERAGQLLEHAAWKHPDHHHATSKSRPGLDHDDERNVRFRLGLQYEPVLHLSEPASCESIAVLALHCIVHLFFEEEKAHAIMLLGIDQGQTRLR